MPVMRRHLADVVMVAFAVAAVLVLVWPYSADSERSATGRTDCGPALFLALPDTKAEGVGEDGCRAAGRPRAGVGVALLVLGAGSLVALRFRQGAASEPDERDHEEMPTRG